MSVTTDADQRADFAREWAEWHHRHEQQRASEHGFLAITGIHWLTTEPQRWDDAPGDWSTGADGVVVDLADGETLVVGGRTVSGRHSFGVIPERGGVLAGFGDAVVEVAKRGGNDVIRPRHPENPIRTSYGGTPAYDPDPRWALPGRFVAYDQPVANTVGSVVDGLEHVYEAPGEIEFEIDGEPQRLVAFPGGADGSLMVLFTDATSGVTTYAANRSLHLTAPDAEGNVVLDFNRATNLPCAYTPHATCPLPPAANRLRLAVEAGEKLP